MFTGLVEGTGKLLRVDRRGADARLSIEAPFFKGEYVLGESIAVDGACLTVVSNEGTVFVADASAETLDRTTLGEKPVGCRLNLERALRLGDRLGGHLVLGHVDGIGVLKAKNRDGRSLRLTFEIPEALARYVIEKGSITVNGLSLTVNGCTRNTFDVNIIPHTAEATTIGDLRVSDRVNIETDLIGKYVEKMLLPWTSPGSEEAPKSRIDEAFLKEHGFF